MKTVLLIDDDRAFRGLLGSSLADEGWRVLEAEDGEAGLNLVLEHRPEVVLCDLLMPRCNGFQVCRAIRAHREHLARTKIVVTTGSGYATDRLNALEAGADEYLVKPVKARELFKLLARLTGTQGPADFVPSSSPSTSDHRPPSVKFWGVRGSIPSPGPGTMFYGGNTSCVEIRADGEIIVCDAGTGIRPLGLSLAAEFKDRPLEVTLLMSHTHWDHIQGFPFFEPAYNPQNKVRVLGYEGARKGLEATISSQMESPYFPVSLQQMPGRITIEELLDMDFSVGKVKVQAAFLHHPGICVGYRFFTSGGSVAYLPDNEPFQRMRLQTGSPHSKDFSDIMRFARDQDQKLVNFVREADALIIDAQYDEKEYQSRAGWGHGCVDDVVALALIAKVKQLFLFHHDPDHDDKHISRMVAGARELVASQGETMSVEAAREGYEFILKPAEFPTQAKVK